MLAILQSARIADMKRAASLVGPRPTVRLPRDPKRRNACLLALIAAERRRSAELIKEMADGG
jgi:hypothetical protein